MRKFSAGGEKLLNIFSFLIYIFALFLMKITGFFSYSFLVRLGKFLGNILYIFPCFGRLCYQNVHAAFPEKSKEEAKDIARKSLQSLALTCLEFLWIRSNEDEWVKMLDLTDADEVAKMGLACLPEGKGAIFVTPHLGNWEISGKLLAQVYKFPMATVARTSRNPYLDKLISGGRSSSGNVEIIYAKGGAKGMKSALNKGKTLGILIDQNVKLRHGGIFVNMFGLPIPVSRAPAVLGRTQNRFFAVGASFRQENGTFKVYLKTLPKPAKDYESDEELIQALTDISEELIRMAPEQYLWMYKRFQYIPEGTPQEAVQRFPSYAKRPNKHFYTNNPLVLGRRKKED